MGVNIVVGGWRFVACAQPITLLISCKGAPAPGILWIPFPISPSRCDSDVPQGKNGCGRRAHFFQDFPEEHALNAGECVGGRGAVQYPMVEGETHVDAPF